MTRYLEPLADSTGIVSTPHGLRACVHRGTREIGGTCVELECVGARLLLDLGLPLDADPALDPASLLPAVPGLNQSDPSLRAIVLSHSHADHWGLIPHAESRVPVMAGAATQRILRAAAPFVPRAIPAQFDLGDDGPTLADRVPVTIGPFRITPYLVDHSAYDAYALLVEAGGGCSTPATCARTAARAHCLSGCCASRRLPSMPC